MSRTQYTFQRISGYAIVGITRTWKPNGPVNPSGGGVTKPIYSVPLFSYFLRSWEHTIPIEFHVYIWQVSPQLSFKEHNKYFVKIENFTYGEINERSFSNPQPWWWRQQILGNLCQYYSCWWIGNLCHQVTNYNGAYFPGETRRISTTRAI